MQHEGDRPLPSLSGRWKSLTG